MSQLLGRLNVKQGLVHFNCCYCKLYRIALVPYGGLWRAFLDSVLFIIFQHRFYFALVTLINNFDPRNCTDGL